jgi:hypothetical protein
MGRVDIILHPDEPPPDDEPTISLKYEQSRLNLTALGHHKLDGLDDRTARGETNQRAKRERERERDPASTIWA